MRLRKLALESTNLVLSPMPSTWWFWGLGRAPPVSSSVTWGIIVAPASLSCRDQCSRMSPANRLRRPWCQPLGLAQE